MRLFGLVVVRNEEHRYLRSMLAKALPLVDQLFVLDDRSTDDSAQVALALGCEVWQREPQAPSFLEHEGRFRQQAWEAFEAACGPEPGDWVLSLDADEAVSGPGLVDALRYRIPKAAAAQGLVGLRLHVGEVFDVDGRQPLVRTDGQWGSITGLRLFAYQPDGVFPDLAMGCGSAPTYVVDGKVRESGEIAILHFGYLDPDDRREKFLRYAGRSGHNEAHIASILHAPITEPWPGHAVVLQRGRTRLPFGAR